MHNLQFYTPAHTQKNIQSQRHAVAEMMAIKRWKAVDTDTQVKPN